MKKFFKKLAFGLALAMTVATVAPAAKASAAAAPKLNVASKKLYLGGDVTGKYSDTVDLNVKNKGNNKVVYTTKDAAIATVDAETGVITAKKVGYVEVTAKLTDKDTKKTTTTLTARIWVKQNADAFGLGSLAKVENALTVGDKVKINAYRGLDGAKYWKQADKTVVTDYVKWTSSDASVAKVDAWGTVTAVAPGEATITAYAAQTEGSTKTTEAKTFAVKVAAANGIKSVLQVSENEATIYFNGTPEVTKDTVVIKDSYGQEFLFDEFDYNADNKAAAVKTIENFSDGMVYTVSVAGVEKTFDFTASVGEVASIKITGPNTVVAYENTKVEYAVYDKNGVDVTDSAENDGIIELVVAEADANNAYISDDEIYFYDINKTAKVTATYHTNEIDAEGNEKTFTDSYTFKSVDPTKVTLGYENVSYKITSDDKLDVDFADNSKIGMSITSAADYPTVELSNTSGKKIYAMIKVNNLFYSNDANEGTTDLNDNSVGSVTFESLDEAKLQVGTDGSLTPSAKGVAKVKITSDLNDRTVIVPIMIVDDPYPVSFTFDKQTISNLSDVAESVTVSDDSNVVMTEVGYGQKATFAATIKDNNGNEMKLKNVVTSVEGLNDNAEAKDSTGDYSFVGSDKKIEFKVNGWDTGVYKYKVTISGTKPNGTESTLSRTIQFTVVEAGKPTDKFQIEADDSKDIKIKTDDKGNVFVDYKLVRLDSKGLKYSYVDKTEYLLKVKSPNGKIVEVNSASRTKDDLKVNGFVTALDLAVTTGSAIKQANVGYGYNADGTPSLTALTYQDTYLGVALRVNVDTGVDNDGNDILLATKAFAGTYTVSVWAKSDAYKVTNQNNDKLIGTKTLKVTNTQDTPKVGVSTTSLKNTVINHDGFVAAFDEKLTGTFGRNAGHFNKINAPTSVVMLADIIATEKYTYNADLTSQTFTVSKLILVEDFGGLDNKDADGNVTDTDQIILDYVVPFNKTITLKKTN